MLDAIAVRRFRTLTLVTAITTYVLVVIGGVVRVTGSGLGCLDWPLCADPLQAEAAILEMLHRFVAGFVSVLVILVAIGAWKAYRQRRWIFRPALIGVGVLIAQILLGAITVWLKNAPYTVALHLGTALTLLACTTIVATAVRTEETPIGDWRHNRLLASSLASALFVFLLILVGAIVTGTNSALACLDWPLCQGQVLPDTTSPYVYIQFLHRLVALITSLVLLRTTIVAWRARERQHTAWVVAALILSLYVVQVTVGAGNVLLKLPLVLRGLHLALASAVWGLLVVLTVLAAQVDKSQRVGHASAADGSLSARSGSAPAVGEVQPVTSQQNVQTRPQGKAMFGAYLLLVKPWITVLLLVTTFAAMLIAQRGLPPLPLVFFTLLGGALSASGASTINSYIDRDIDGRMSRTKRRPVPTQRVDPDHALAFGLFLSVASFVILTLFVNLLAAILSTIGILYYVVIYTGWLKRATPHNIVIGGIAGAIPPLVGWAAVTGRVDVTALYLFLIIFYWTPPHTWALGLLVRTDYERVGVPMLPVVRGDAETRRQIVWYSLQLIAITLLLFAFQMMGWIYFAGALILNGIFLWMAFVLARSASKASARRLYKYSQLYLALLFLVMVIDKVVLL